MNKDTKIIDYIFEECMGWDTPDYYFEYGRLILSFEWFSVSVGNYYGDGTMLWWLDGELLCFDYQELADVGSGLDDFVDYLNAAGIKVEELEEVRA